MNAIALGLRAPFPDENAPMAPNPPAPGPVGRVGAPTVGLKPARLTAGEFKLFSVAASVPGEFCSGAPGGSGVAEVGIASGSRLRRSAESHLRVEGSSANFEKGDPPVPAPDAPESDVATVLFGVAVPPVSEPEPSFNSRSTSRIGSGRAPLLSASRANVFSDSRM